MGLESGNYISDLVATNPAGVDQRYTVDDHIRLIKSVLKNTFPNLNGAVSRTPAELNSVKSASSTKTATYNVTAADHGKTIYANASSAPFTITFDSCASLGSGFRVTIIKNDTSSNIVTLDPNGSETIEGAGTYQLQQFLDRVDLTTDGSNLFSGQLGRVFTSGTKVVFAQASAPTGWTQDTSKNDRVLRVVSGAGGGTGGSWTISGLTVAGTALTIAQMPAHGHPYVTAGYMPDNGVTKYNGGFWVSETNINFVGPNSGPVTTAHGQQIGGTGGGGAHSHGLSADGNWRPAYTDVIVCSKN